MTTMETDEKTKNERIARIGRYLPYGMIGDPGRRGVFGMAFRGGSGSWWVDAIFEWIRIFLGDMHPCMMPVSLSDDASLPFIPSSLIPQTMIEWIIT